MDASKARKIMRNARKNKSAEWQEAQSIVEASVVPIIKAAAENGQSYENVSFAEAQIDTSTVECAGQILKDKGYDVELGSDLKMKISWEDPDSPGRFLKLHCPLISYGA